MSAPQLRVAPTPTAEAMAMLGDTKIADILGTYSYLLGERDGLFHRLLEIEDSGDPETRADRHRALFKAWRAAERRLDLYRLLINEVDGL
jgi:hypothetical protein